MMCFPLGRSAAFHPCMPPTVSPPSDTGLCGAGLLLPHQAWPGGVQTPAHKQTRVGTTYRNHITSEPSLSRPWQRDDLPDLFASSVSSLRGQPSSSLHAQGTRSKARFEKHTGRQSTHLSFTAKPARPETHTSRAAEQASAGARRGRPAGAPGEAGSEV